MKKPMKGVDCLGELSRLLYPKYLQPKYDGIRIIFEDGIAWSASLKPIRNKAIQEVAAFVPDGLECEFYLPNELGGLRKSASVCNSERGGIPDESIFYAFDVRNTPLTYSDRLIMVHEIVDSLKYIPIEVAPTSKVNSQLEVEAKLVELLNGGYEGAMLKEPTALYKYGRSTLNSQECLKLKPFIDGEGYVIGYKYEQENTNEAFVNELGNTARSSSQLGKADKPLIGALQLQSPQFPEPFWVSGFTHSLKERMFHERESLIGRIVTFKYQPCEVYDRPRHPIFRRFRPISE